jgi:hypothetical protein
MEDSWILHRLAERVKLFPDTISFTDMWRVERARYRAKAKRWLAASKLRAAQWII